MILPGAGRVWKAVIDQRQLNIKWIDAEFGMDSIYYSGAWRVLALHERTVNGVREQKWLPYDGPIGAISTGELFPISNILPSSPS